MRHQESGQTRRMGQRLPRENPKNLNAFAWRFRPFPSAFIRTDTSCCVRGTRKALARELRGGKPESLFIGDLLSAEAQSLAESSLSFVKLSVGVKPSGGRRTHLRLDGKAGDFGAIERETGHQALLIKEDGKSPTADSRRGERTRHAFIDDGKVG